MQFSINDHAEQAWPRDWGLRSRRDDDKAFRIYKQTSHREFLQTSSPSLSWQDSKELSNWLAFISSSVFEVFDLWTSFFWDNFVIRYNCELSALYPRNTYVSGLLIFSGSTKTVVIAFSTTLLTKVEYKNVEFTVFVSTHHIYRYVDVLLLKPPALCCSVETPY